MAKKSEGYALLETIFAVTAFVLMWIGSINCDFVKFTDTSGTSAPISLQFGVWYYQFWSMVTSVDGRFVFESCHGYPDYMDIDPAWKAARAFSVMAFILSMIVFIVAIISACSTADSTRGWMAPMYMLTCLCQGLMLLLLSSNACKNNMLVKGIDAVNLSGIVFPETCSMAAGAKYIVSATVFWFVAGIASFTANKAAKTECEEEVDDSLTEPLAGP